MSVIRCFIACLLLHSFCHYLNHLLFFFYLSAISYLTCCLSVISLAISIILLFIGCFLHSFCCWRRQPPRHTATMDAIKKKMQAMKLEKDNAMDRADTLEQQNKETNIRAEKVTSIPKHKPHNIYQCINHSTSNIW